MFVRLKFIRFPTETQLLKMSIFVFFFGFVKKIYTFAFAMHSFHWYLCLFTMLFNLCSFNRHWIIFFFFFWNCHFYVDLLRVVAITYVSFPTWKININIYDPCLLLSCIFNRNKTTSKIQMKSKFLSYDNNSSRINVIPNKLIKFFLLFSTQLIYHWFCI